MFLTMFFKTQNIVQTMHLTMLIAHPYVHRAGVSESDCVKKRRDVIAEVHPAENLYLDSKGN